jgi:hypothetical protein
MTISWDGIKEETLRSMVWCTRTIIGGAAGGYIVKATFDPLPLQQMLVLGVGLLVALVTLDLFVRRVASY